MVNNYLITYKEIKCIFLYAFDINNEYVQISLAGRPADSINLSSFEDRMARDPHLSYPLAISRPRARDRMQIRDDTRCRLIRSPWWVRRGISGRRAVSRFDD